MTLPDERYRALVEAQKLMLDITNSRATPRLPKSLRERSRAVLRHYPSTFEIGEMMYDPDSCSSFGGLGQK